MKSLAPLFVALVALVAIGCGGVPAAPVVPPASPSASSAAPTAPSPGPPASSAAAPAAAAAPAPQPPSTFDVEAVDDYIARHVVARGFTGLSVAIVRDGALVLAKGYGKSALSPDAAVTPDTPFSIGSISKQFVSVLVLQLAHEKKLSIDDRVAKYFPDLTRATDISLYDLMTHVSGYRDDYPLDFVDREMKQPVATDDVIARYAKRPLDFEPRTRWSYSSTNYKILGRVIERVTKKPLGVVMRDRIFAPLAMEHASYMPAEDGPGLARGYTTFALGPVESAAPEARDWAFGGGGIYASPTDIAKWNVALTGGKVLDKHGYEILTMPRRLADGRMTRYGCGIGSSLDRGGDTVLRHSGGSAGFLSYSVIVPRIRASVVAFSNRDDVPPYDVVNEIVALLNKEHRPPLPAITGPSAKEVALDLFLQLQSGHVDRARFGADFNAYLTDAMIQNASAALRPLGAPTDVKVGDASERGEMEVVTVTFTFATTKLDALMYRSVDGTVQEILIRRP